MTNVLHHIVGGWWLPFVLAFGIIGWAYRSFGLFRAKIEPLKAALSQAVTRLEAVENSKGFYRDYEEIRPGFTDDPVVGAAWTEYEATFILSADRDVVRNARRPSEFFNDGLYYKGGVNLRDFESVPNQLVGVGLLFTFIGLVLSLLIARQGLGADIEQAKAALGDLLNAAAFKFVTSIAALLSSVVYVSYKNKLLHETDDLIERFCHQIERVMDQVTGEALADESRRELISQTVQLERFNSELAVSIAEALDGKLRESLSVAMQPVATEIGRLSERMGEMNQDALERMVDRFSSELGGAAKEHTEQMGHLMQTAAESMAALPGHIDAAGERFVEQIRAGADELTVSMTAAAENVDATLQGSTRGLAKAVEASAKQFAAVAEGIEATHAQQLVFVQQLGAGQDEIMGRIQGVLDSVSQTAEQLVSLSEQVTAAGKAASGLGDLAGGVAEAANLLRQTSEQVSELADQTRTLNGQAGDTLDRLTQQVGALEQEISSMNNALAAAFEKVSTGVGQFGDKTTSFVKQLDKDLADALGRLSGAIQQLDEVLGQMPKKADFAQLAKAISGERTRKGAGE